MNLTLKFPLCFHHGERTNHRKPLTRCWQACVSHLARMLWTPVTNTYTWQTLAHVQAVAANVFDTRSQLVRISDQYERAGPRSVRIKALMCYSGCHGCCNTSYTRFWLVGWSWRAGPPKENNRISARSRKVMSPFHILVKEIPHGHGLLSFI